MAESSDSEEFYDAEELTPIKGSKRPSLTKSVSQADTKSDSKEEDKSSNNPLVSVQGPSVQDVSATDGAAKTVIKNVVEDRRRFQELRRCMQTEEEDEGLDQAGSFDQYSCNMEHPFKVISHDTMSLQSMTSLGRIGRILSGASESHPNLRESVKAPSVSSRDPSTKSDDPVTVTSNVRCCMEPDVIASTKASSLKSRPPQPAAAPSRLVTDTADTAIASGSTNTGANGGINTGANGSISTGGNVGAIAVPVAPPRRKKRNKLHGSQSLSMNDGDNVSVCTNDTDDYRYLPSTDLREKPPNLDQLLNEPSHVINPQSMSLPSPASTIESLTREFQDSLELSSALYEKSPSAAELCSPSHKAQRHKDPLLHINDAVKGSYVVRPHDEEKSRGGSRTHSETRRAHSSNNSSLGSNGRTTGRRVSCDDVARSPRLSDMEILDQVTVLNLDTGERMPLSEAEHKLPQCINPLSLHIMRITSEYIGRTKEDENTSTLSEVKSSSWRMRFSRLNFNTSAFNLRRAHSANLSVAMSRLSIDTPNRETDEESESVCAGGVEDETKETKRESSDKQTNIKRKTEKLKRFFGSTVKKTVDAAKSLAQEVSHARHKEDVADIADDVRGEHNIKLKASNSHKGPYDFDGCVRHVQEMDSAHVGAVWCCKFSVCGRLLATAGQDKLLRIWVTRDSYNIFQDMRTKYNAEQKCSPSPSQESLPGPAPPPPPPPAPFHPSPFAVYRGHTSDLLDVSWSKNYFILSSSMDKTVRLWHISRGECLCCFQHIDFVTAIVFHPRDDRYFLSGSLDGKLRLWNIPDKKVAVWNEVDGKTNLITAANFCQNGKFAVVGTYDGRCIFYTTDQLKYYTQIDVRSTRGKNSTGRKISGVEPMPNDDKILVTSNDSRIRLYDLRDLNLSCKYKGYVNISSQIKASFSHDGKYIVSGSENQCIYIWKTYHDYSKFTSVRRDRNDFWEGIKAHNAVVTCAIFAPNPDYFIRMIAEREEEEKRKDGIEKEEVKSPEGGLVASSQTGHVLVSADFNGCIKVFVHKAKPKHSSLPASALA